MIAEKGGVNLYSFVKNRVLNKIDIVGLLEASCSESDCCDLEELNGVLNQHVTSQINQSSSIEEIRDRLAQDIRHKHSKGLTRIDGWIEGL